MNSPSRTHPVIRETSSSYIHFEMWNIAQDEWFSRNENWCVPTLSFVIYDGSWTWKCKEYICHFQQSYWQLIRWIHSFTGNGWFIIWIEFQHLSRIFANDFSYAKKCRVYIGHFYGPITHALICLSQSAIHIWCHQKFIVRIALFGRTAR